jgi:hypothetical protein
MESDGIEWNEIESNDTETRLVTVLAPALGRDQSLLVATPRPQILVFSQFAHTLFSSQPLKDHLV